MLEKLKTLFLKNDFIKGVFSVGSGNLAAQFINVITVPLVSRIFTDAEHGQYSMIVSSASLITTFCTLGLTSAIMLPRDDEESNQVLLTGFTATVLISLLFGLGLFLISPQWKLFELNMNYYLAVFFMLFHIIVVTLKNLLYTAVNRAKLNKVLMFNPIIGACATLLLTIPMGLLGFGAYSFIIAGLVSEIVNIIHMLHYVNPFKTRFSMRGILRIIRKYKEYVVYQCPANMVSGFAIQAPVQILGRIFSAGMLGNFSMCVNLMHYPSRLIAAPINTVYFRTANQYIQEGKNLSEFTYQLIRLILIAAFIPIVVAILAAQPVFVFILGDQWSEAGKIASLLVYPVIIEFCSTCISYCRVTLGKQKYNLVFCSIRLIATMAALLGGYFIFHDFHATIVIYAFAYTFTGLLDVGLSLYCLKDHFKKFVKLITIYTLLILAVYIVKRIL